MPHAARASPRSVRDISGKSLNNGISWQSSVCGSKVALLLLFFHMPIGRSHDPRRHKSQLLPTFMIYSTRRTKTLVFVSVISFKKDPQNIIRLKKHDETFPSKNSTSKAPLQNAFQKWSLK